MKIKPGELSENGYFLLDKLEHKELVPFIQTYMKKRTKYSVFYYISNFLVFGLVVYLFVKGYNLERVREFYSEFGKSRCRIMVVLAKSTQDSEDNMVYS